MIFPAEKRQALMVKYADAGDRRVYLKTHTLPQIETALQRLNLELDRFDEKDLSELSGNPRDLTLFHRVVLDLQEQCELLDLSMQRIELTYSPESAADMAVFRDFSRRVASTFERAFLRRELAESIYRARRAASPGVFGGGIGFGGGGFGQNGSEFCLDPAAVVDELRSAAEVGEKAPVLSSIVGTLQKIFSCTLPRK